jgi:hypothetical protein
MLKGKGATDKYDSLGQNRLVVIDLKKDSIKNFPPKIRMKLKDN